MEPHPEVLSRDNSEKAPALKVFGDLADEVVNFGTRLFAWCLEVAPGNGTNLVIALVLHQFLETLDGAAVLLREGCTEPAKLALRSAMESMLAIVFILEKDPDDRARWYLVGDARRKITILRRLNPATEEGKEVRRSISKDTSGFNLDEDSLFRDTTSDVSRIEEALGKEEALSRVNAEWNERKRRIGRRPDWFSLFDGPKDIKQLATDLGRGAWYEVLYVRWSATTHGSDALARLEVPDGKAGAIRGLRHPGDLQQLASIAASMGIGLFRAVVTQRVRARLSEFEGWYLDIRAPYQRVSSLDPMIGFREPKRAEQSG